MPQCELQRPLDFYPIYRNDSGMKPDRIVIGVDLDDILLDFMSPLCEWHNDVHQTAHSRDDYVSFDLSKVWNCSRSDANERVSNFYHSDHHKNAVPVAGAQTGLQALKENYRFVVITARAESMEREMRAWLDTHFGDLFDEVIFTNHYHGTGVKRNKSSVCLELGVSLFIEDALHNAHDVASVGIPVLLFDTPWNQEVVSGLITRVSSWEDILVTIKNL